MLTLWLFDIELGSVFIPYLIKSVTLLLYLRLDDTLPSVKEKSFILLGLLESVIVCILPLGVF